MRWMSPMELSVGAQISAPHLPAESSRKPPSTPGKEIAARDAVRDCDSLPMSLLQQIFGDQPRRRQKYYVKRPQKCEPYARQLGRIPQDSHGGFGAGNQDRRQHGEQQERQKQLPQARLGSDGGKNR